MMGLVTHRCWDFTADADSVSSLQTEEAEKEEGRAMLKSEKARYSK